MPPDPPRLGRLHRHNFSPRVRTPSGYLHQFETCIIKRIVRWWCMTCGTPELSWSTGATKATTETKLRVQLEQTPFTSDLVDVFFGLCCWWIVPWVPNGELSRSLRREKKITSGHWSYESHFHAILGSYILSNRFGADVHVCFHWRWQLKFDHAWLSAMKEKIKLT